MRLKACIPLLVVILCCETALSRAEVTVRDDWVGKGEVVLASGDWQVVLSQAEAALMVVRGGQRVRVRPFGGGGEATSLLSCRAGDATVQATFAAGGAELAVGFRFASAGTIHVTPGYDVDGLTVRCPLEVGVLPGLRLEDVFYRPAGFPNADALHVPAENWFAGLLAGGNGMVVCAWPGDGQTVRLLLKGSGPQRRAEGIEIGTAGKGLYLELLAAPGIWHNEPLKPTYLEKDVTLDWQRPFAATYKTQLPMRTETTAPRTFTFGAGRSSMWRPEVGEYVRPTWFSGAKAHLFLSKRIPPKGDAIIYPSDDADATLMGFVRRTRVADAIIQRSQGRGLPSGPAGAPNVGFNACYGTFLVRRSIYAAGTQDREQVFLGEHADYLADNVAAVQTRNAAYSTFVETMRARLANWLADESDAAVRAYLEDMVDHVERVEAGHARKMARFGNTTHDQHIARAQRNAARLKALLGTPGQEMFPEFLTLVDELNRLSWAHDEETGMRFGMTTRAWAQAAALGCATTPGAVEYARQIRAAIRDALNGAPDW